MRNIKYIIVGDGYLSTNTWRYYSPRYDRYVTVAKGEYSDGATCAPDLDSDGWWVHDMLCRYGRWDNGELVTNIQASMVLYDIMIEEGYAGWWARAWRIATFLGGGGAARENGMVKVARDALASAVEIFEPVTSVTKMENSRVRFRKVALGFTLPHEGGTNYHVNDRGGLTNFGISQKQYPDVDIRGLTQEMALEIYRTDYWKACKCDDLHDSVAAVMFDTAVNCGAHSARKWLQRSLRVEPDGVLGPITMAAVKTKNPYNLAAKVIGYRMMRYVRLIKNRPEQKSFALGWMKRCADLAFYI